MSHRQRFVLVVGSLKQLADKTGPLMGDVLHRPNLGRRLTVLVGVGLILVFVSLMQMDFFITKTVLVPLTTRETKETTKTANTLDNITSSNIGLCTRDEVRRGPTRAMAKSAFE